MAAYDNPEYQVYGEYGKKTKFVSSLNYGGPSTSAGLLVPIVAGPGTLWPDQFRQDVLARWNETTLESGLLGFGQHTVVSSQGTLQTDYKILEGASLFDEVHILEASAELEKDGKTYKRQMIRGVKAGMSMAAALEEGLYVTGWDLLQTDPAEARRIIRSKIVYPGDFGFLVGGYQDFEVDGGDLPAPRAKEPVIINTFWDRGSSLGEYPSVRMNTMQNDFYFTQTAPFSKDELEEIGNSMSTAYYDISANYNFLNQSYESMISFGEVPAIYLPNMYLFLTAKYATTPGSGISYLTTLAGSVPLENLDLLNENVGSLSLEKQKEFFTQYAGYLSTSADGTYVAESIKNTNIGFSNENVDYLISYAEKAALFPMYVDIKMSTQTDTIIAQSLKDFQFDYPLLKTIMQANINRASLEGNLQLEKFYTVPGIRSSQTLDTDALDYASDNGPEGPAELISYTTSINAQFLDVMKWLEEYKEQGEQYFDTEAEALYRFVGESQDDTVTNAFFKSIYTMILKGKLKGLAAQKSRSFKDLLKSKEAYNEVLAYKITKHRVDLDGNISSVPTQTFYFTNSNELKDLRYIDTQVMFGERFKYVVWTYSLVVGTEYFYSDLKIINEQASDQYVAQFYANYRPVVRLVETPLFGLEPQTTQTMAYMWDDPPVPPEGFMVPVMGQTNKLKIFLNGATGRFAAEPISLGGDDQVTIPNIRGYQKLPKTYGDKIIYESDDPINVFEIYRIGPDKDGKTKKPFSYSDFVGKKHKSLNEPEANSTAVIDTLQPNKKYYYIFRGIDYHGNASLPSALYEVEMVMEPGADISYPVVRTVEFAVDKNYRQSKAMRRFFHIKPKVTQIMIKAETLSEDGFLEVAEESQNFQLGVLDKQLFVNKDLQDDSSLKRFKIRATSRQTGRKIDFNVRFVWKHKTHYG